MRCATHSPAIGWPSDQTAVPFEDEQFLAAGRLPHLRTLIVTAGDNALAVRGKRYRAYRTAVPFEGQQFFAAGRLPHPRRLILTSGDTTRFACMDFGPLLSEDAREATTLQPPDGR